MVDRHHDAPGDAVTAALTEIGRVEPMRDDDLSRAMATMRSFHASRRRQLRVRMVAVTSFAVAAAVVLGWWALPQLRRPGFEIDEGRFLVQLDRLDTGEHVPAGHWLEPEGGRACVQLHARRLCAEPGARLRVHDEGTVELARGRMRADGALQVITPIGEVIAGSDGFELAFDDATAALHNAGAAVTLVQDGVSIALEPGAHASSAARGDAAYAQAEAPAPTSRAVPTSTPVQPTVREGNRAPRPKSDTATSPGEMLAGARALASHGKLAAAAGAYQKLIDTHPDSGEARAAWVSLGRVQASRGRHAAALAAHGHYLDGGGGPLAEEAHFGRIAALHALGRHAERDHATAAFAAAFPRSIYLGKAQALARP